MDDSTELDFGALLLRAEADPPSVLAAVATMMMRIVFDVWSQQAAGDLDASRACRARLVPAARYVLRHGDEPGPHGEVAGMLEVALGKLAEAERLAGPPALPAEIGRTQRPVREAEVLRVLWEAGAEYLGRKEVMNRMRRELRPGSVQRVGQILAGLTDRGLLQRHRWKRQGARAAAHYRLSVSGREAYANIREPAMPAIPVFDLPNPTAGHEVGAAQSLDTVVPGPRNVVFMGPGATPFPASWFGGIARRLTAHGRHVLAIDFALTQPALDVAFPLPGLAECRGLSGLIAEYRAQPERSRPRFLREALDDPEFVARSDELPLSYLPTGLGARPGVNLRQVVGLLDDDPAVRSAVRGDPAPARFGFVHDLRRALTAREPEAVLIHAGSGLAGAAFVAVSLLADALALVVGNAVDQRLCRVVVGQLARMRRMSPEVASSSTVVVRLRDPAPAAGMAPTDDRFAWPRLIYGQSTVDLPPGESCPVDERGALRGGGGRSLQRFEVLSWEIQRLAGVEGKSALRPEQRRAVDEGLKAVCDPGTDGVRRSLALGRLGRFPVHWGDYLRERIEAFWPTTVTEGRDGLIRSARTSLLQTAGGHGEGDLEFRPG